MKVSRFTDEEKRAILRQAETGRAVKEICRDAGISPTTYFNWKSDLGAGNAHAAPRPSRAPGMSAAPRKAQRGLNTAVSLVKGLELLRAFQSTEQVLRNADFAERLGLSKATTSRLTGVLAALGYLHADKSRGGFSLGPATVALGYAALTTNPIVHLARPLMQSLADISGVAVALGTANGTEMVYLANCRSDSPVSLRLNVGSQVPMLTTAMGLAYLCGLAEAEREACVARLVASGTASPAECRAAISRALKEHRRLGYVTSIGLWRSYVNAAGVFLRPTDGSPNVAITCGGIADAISEADIHRTAGPQLKRLVADLLAQIESHH